MNPSILLIQKTILVVAGDILIFIVIIIFLLLLGTFYESFPSHIFNARTDTSTTTIEWAMSELRIDEIT